MSVLARIDPVIQMKKKLSYQWQRLSWSLCLLSFGVTVSIQAAPRSATVTNNSTSATRLISTNRPAGTNVAAGLPAAGPVSVDVAAVEKDRILKLATSALIIEPV